MTLKSPTLTGESKQNGLLTRALENLPQPPKDAGYCAR